MDERIQRRVEKLEQQCQKEAKEFAKKVQELQKSNQVRRKVDSKSQIIKVTEKCPIIHKDIISLSTH